MKALLNKVGCKKISTGLTGQIRTILIIMEFSEVVKFFSKKISKVLVVHGVVMQGDRRAWIPGASIRENFRSLSR